MNSEIETSKKHSALIRVIGVLLISIIVIQIPKLMALHVFDSAGSKLIWSSIAACIMIILPFSLKRFFPSAADYSITWLPKRVHWFWFLLLTGGVVIWGKGIPYMMSLMGIPLSGSAQAAQGITPVIIIVNACLLIGLGPLAEELFWRGYVQGQLQRIVPRVPAWLLQAIVFAGLHFQGIAASFVIVGYGLAFGFWRLRYRSLLPLIIAHIVLNAVIMMPVIKAQYTLASYSENIKNKPPVQAIDVLTQLPAQQSIPQIIPYLSHEEDEVQYYAVYILSSRFGSEGAEYFRKALLGKEQRIISGILNVIQMGQYNELIPDVRKLIYASSDIDVQVSAILTLNALGDVQGLREIAEKHSSEKVKKTAERFITTPDIQQSK